jgi:magnesium-transporting ATPase (P-type)
MTSPKAPISVDWHQYDINDLYDSLQSSPFGLTTAEAQHRQTEVGMNFLPEASPPHPLMRLIKQFHNPLIYLLLVAAGVAFWLNHIVDTVVIMAAVLVNAITGFVQEQRAQRAMNALSELITPRVKVKRDGIWQDLSSRALVPGDVVMIEAGDRIAADAKLIQSHRLRIDESMLTGESVPANKAQGQQTASTSIHARESMVFAGTLAVQGQAQVLIVATATHTELGRVNHLIAEITPLTTPLIQQIDRFSRRFGLIILAGSAGLYVFAVYGRGYSPSDALFAIIGLSVAAIPEGLPAVITITMAIGVQRMAKQHAIIRHLPAVETLGATTVICSDKTGTLTRNEMTVQHLFLPGTTVSVGGVGYAPVGDLQEENDNVFNPQLAQLFFEACVLCNQADLFEQSGTWVSAGDPMEAALLTLAMKAKLDIKQTRDNATLTDQIPFAARARFMATQHQTPQGTRIYIKGAPELLLAHCDRELSQTGQTLALEINRWQDLILQCAQRGERVLALATLDDTSQHPLNTWQDTLPKNLALLGFVSMIDPPRAEAMAAIAQCYQAGIDVKMITGDHAITALSIAKQLGLAVNPTVITGQELDQLTDQQWPETIQRTQVFARTHPEHKLRIVKTLQAQHAVVAMTGDGVNDAPALKQANIGISMGQKSTEAAKQASSMVLADDNFTSIVAAVKEGRTVYDNIQKVIAWTLPTNCAEALIMIIAIVLGFTLPISAAQILWVNLVTASTLGLSLAFEPSEPSILIRPPRAAQTPLLSKFLVWRIALVSCLILLSIYGTIAYAQFNQFSIAHQNTLVVNSLVVLEVAYLFAVRFLHQGSVSHVGIIGTPAVWLAVGVVVVLQLALTYVPWLNQAFELKPATATDWAFILSQGVILLVVLETEKWLTRHLPFLKKLVSRPSEPV